MNLVCRGSTFTHPFGTQQKIKNKLKKAPSSYFSWLGDEKQGYYLEWPYGVNTAYPFTRFEWTVDFPQHQIQARSVMCWVLLEGHMTTLWPVCSWPAIIYDCQRLETMETWALDVILTREIWWYLQSGIYLDILYGRDYWQSQLSITE